MKQYLLRSHLYIPESDFTTALRKKLTFKNPEIKKYAMWGRSVPDDILDNYILFKRIPEYNIVRVPRYAFGRLSTFLDDYDVVEDNTITNIDIEYTSKDRLLNSSQEKTVSGVMDNLAEEYGSIIVGDAGEGKTLMAIWLICELKVKTIVLMHKDILLKQWKEALLELTDIKEDEIGLLKGGKFKDGKVVLGSQASLMRSTIGSEINRLFTLKIQDEVHRIGATMFLKSFTRFNSKYVLGLSATPERDDKLEKIYFYHTSDNLVMHKSVRRIGAEYFIIPYNNKHTHWKSYGRYMPFRTTLLYNLEDDNFRNNLLMSAITISLHNGRKVLVVGEHIRHLLKFLDVIRVEFPDKKVVRFFGVRKLTTIEKRKGIVQEKYVDPDLSDLIAADCIVGTYKKAMESVDIPPLDTLVPITPLSSKVGVQQVIGRIERKYDGKQQPVVIDVVDKKYPLTLGMSRKRIAQYEKLGMNLYSGMEYDSILNKI